MPRHTPTELRPDIVINEILQLVNAESCTPTRLATALSGAGRSGPIAKLSRALATPEKLDFRARDQLWEALSACIRTCSNALKQATPSNATPAKLKVALRDLLRLTPKLLILDLESLQSGNYEGVVRYFTHGEGRGPKLLSHLRQRVLLGDLTASDSSLMEALPFALRRINDARQHLLDLEGSHQSCSPLHSAVGSITSLLQLKQSEHVRDATVAEALWQTLRNWPEQTIRPALLTILCEQYHHLNYQGLARNAVKLLQASEFLRPEQIVGYTKALAEFLVSGALEGVGTPAPLLKPISDGENAARLPLLAVAAVHCAVTKLRERIAAKEKREQRGQKSSGGLPHYDLGSIKRYQAALVVTEQIGEALARQYNVANDGFTEEQKRSFAALPRDIRIALNGLPLFSDVMHVNETAWRWRS